jgi:endonuclease YncB( thermonuclease family)
MWSATLLSPSVCLRKKESLAGGYLRDAGRHVMETKLFRLLSVAVVALLLCARPSAAEFRSYAVVQDDGSLLIQNRVVRLFGVYIPDPKQFCDTQLRPAFCGNRAAVALNFKIQGFVTCQEMGTYDDGSISAVCWTKRSNFSEGTDLGAYLIREGLALAGPDAPYEYQALQRIAEANGLGIWGFQADRFFFFR